MGSTSSRHTGVSVDKFQSPPGSFDGDSRSLTSNSDEGVGLTEAEKLKLEHKLLRKLDWCLIPWLCLLYLCSFLNRTNIGNAKIDGLQASLGNMSGGMYNASLCIFFISYAIAEPITNVMLKHFRPSIFIPIMMVLWGLCMTFMGLVDNWSGLMAARWFLGLCEAGLFPGVSFYLSCWYKRSELGVRTAIFFSAAAVSGSFGGLLAAAIALLDGVGGKPGWAWIFLLEGLFTVFCGVISLWWVQDFPPEAKFLSEEERKRVICRLRKDKQSSAGREQMQFIFFKQAMTDYKTWLGMFIYMGTDMPLYAFSLFLPSIINGFGCSSTVSQLLTVPPYFVAASLTILVGYLADTTHRRGVFNICISLFGISGFAILIGADNFKVRYAGTFLAALGIYPCISNTISWIANNIEGSYKRGIVLGMVIGWGNLNGIVSSNIYLATDAPRYRIGHCIVMAYMAIFLLGGSIAMHFLLRRENNARQAGRRDHLVQGLSTREINMLGDQRPDFRYTL